MPKASNSAPDPQGQDSWPREVIIQPTIEKAIELLGGRYDSSRDPEGDDALAFEIGSEMRITAEIKSWEHFDLKYEGYELVDSELQEEFMLNMEDKYQKEQDQDLVNRFL